MAARREDMEAGREDMAPAILDLRRKANEAYHNDEFELAAELYTQAIDATPSTTDLYAKHARTLIRLRKRDGAFFSAPALPDGSIVQFRYRF
ncbi:hypothetical protein E2562_034932 [Oryza meyeriana var. granulata]|uniref:Uncharacterized protein n=1 Tax=Oryza meyeriana var. granulata TaxID=110450 RepID=A0A6G1F1I7_9ORYZ|nr:hypothetical protein E2562_034932 [Oryza meyeriana var. granulata]